MARIKFLDILEETKSKPSFSYEEKEAAPKRTENYERRTSAQRPAYREQLDNERPLRSERSDFRREQRPSDFSRREPIRSSSSGATEDTNKLMWMTALFIFFGGVLFMGGYWLGKTVNSNLELEKAAIAEMSSPIPAPIIEAPVSPPVSADIPKAAPLKATPLSPAKKVAAPAKPASKNVSTGEYVVQISAHEKIEAARSVEEKLVAAKYNAYISEYFIGEKRIFRVRIRGFKNKAEADKTLASVKGLGIGIDGLVLKLD